MGIGIGTFLGLVFIGTIYLYIQTKDTWNWKKIWKLVGIGIGALIVIPLIIGVIVWGYSELTDYYDKKPKIISTLHGLKLGEKLSDVEFKLPLNIAKIQGNEDSVTKYDISDQKNREISFDKNNLLISLGETCSDDKGKNGPAFEPINGIGCGATSEAIINKYGKNNIRIQCLKNPEKSDQSGRTALKFRVYDAVDYGVRHWLASDYTYAIIVTRPDTLKSWTGINWIPCEDAERLNQSKEVK